MATILGAGFSVVVVGVDGGGGDRVAGGSGGGEGSGAAAGAGAASPSDPGAAEGPADAVAIAAIAAARDLLPAAGPRFVVGVGAGGLYARLAGCAILGLDGVVAFGGRVRYAGVSARRPIQPLDLLPGLGCALQCHFRDDDPETPPAHVDELERRLAGVSRGWQVFRYPASRGGADRHDRDVRGGERAAAPSVGTSTTEASSWQGADAATAWGRARAFLLHLAAERA
ncbi:MAG: hypothetical protein ACK4YP_24305 [Myxococcota bacterium]